MTSRFSGVLQLSNLDDFITPSQECIKPVEIQKSKSKTGSKIKIEDNIAYAELNETRYTEPLKKVEITLADCLACSGCITSAESVLVNQQSQEELLKVFHEKTKLQQQEKGSTIKFIVISLAVQPILSIAERYKLDPQNAATKLAGYFKKLGADMVLDMTLADDFALLESAKEFIERYKAAHDGTKNQLPMFTSSCPGWICYAEKTHGNFILPFISVVKSPQQIMGSLVKYHLGQKLGFNPEQIYHVTLMPCYDKKLEASRQDFYNELRKCREVDCVITPIEMEQIFQEQNVVLNEITSEIVDKPFELYGEYKDNILYGHEGSGSGGYADFIFHYAMKQLFQDSNSKLEYKNLRNPDFRDVSVEKDGKVVLKIGIANGFRNIQNLVQKLKRGKCDYHYVEIMACPSGCVNGGAQIRPHDGSQPKELALKLETLYNQLPQSIPETNFVINHLYNTWLEEGNSDKLVTYFRTEYHEIEKINTALAIKW